MKLETKLKRGFNSRGHKCVLGCAANVHEETTVAARRWFFFQSLLINNEALRSAEGFEIKPRHNTTQHVFFPQYVNKKTTGRRRGVLIEMSRDRLCLLRCLQQGDAEQQKIDHFNRSAWV